MVAHEYGHYVQELSGVIGAYYKQLSTVGVNSSAGLLLSRRLELQAQCFSGMFFASAGLAGPARREGRRQPARGLRRHGPQGRPRHSGTLRRVVRPGRRQKQHRALQHLERAGQHRGVRRGVAQLQGFQLSSSNSTAPPMHGLFVGKLTCLAVMHRQCGAIGGHRAHLFPTAQPDPACSAADVRVCPANGSPARAHHAVEASSRELRSA